jgi:spermidine synthase
MALYEHDGAYSISMTGQELMHSKASASESLLGKLGVEHLDYAKPARVLIGGMGLGFTLRSVLESAGAEVAVELVELIPEVIEWNKVHLDGLNGECLDDPRVQVRTEDVTRVIHSANPKTYDSILLDVDNGPVAMVASRNKSLYGQSGINAIKRSLTPSGRAIFWSAGQDNKFDSLLKRSGFDVRVVRAKVHETAKRPAYFLYIAEK